MIPVDTTEQPPGDPASNAGCGGLCRRRVLTAGAGTLLGASMLVACGSGGSSSDTSSTAAGQTGGAPSSDAPGSDAPGGGDAAGGGGALTQAADVPVGGAVSAQDADGKPVLVCQPKAGTFVAFSAICTHMGCTVAPNGDHLQCPCHGSTYDLATGDNTGGPAPSPLTRIDVTVHKGEVVAS